MSLFVLRRWRKVDSVISPAGPRNYRQMPDQFGAGWALLRDGAERDGGYFVRTRWQLMLRRLDFGWRRRCDAGGG